MRIRSSRSASSAAVRSAIACLHLGPRAAHPLAGLGPRGRRQRSDLGAGQRQRRPVAEVGEPGGLELVQVGRGGDGRQRLVPRLRYLLGGKHGHLHRVILFTACRHPCLPRLTECDAPLAGRAAERSGRAIPGHPPGQPARGNEPPDLPPRQPKSGVPAGMVNRNSAPPPGAVSTPIVPPCASTRPFTMNRPRPVPLRRLARQNWRNTLGASSGAIALALIAHGNSDRRGAVALAVASVRRLHHNGYGTSAVPQRVLDQVAR